MNRWPRFADTLYSLPNPSYQAMFTMHSLHSIHQDVVHNTASLLKRSNNDSHKEKRDNLLLIMSDDTMMCVSYSTVVMPT
mmetsp:Transcript_3909/g.5683  ORF Transcript_3909/g.5683 Transcript_3909/m.5683 type:complete len:80 (-) Transcript_3909:788-1027(-)